MTRPTVGRLVDQEVEERAETVGQLRRGVTGGGHQADANHGGRSDDGRTATACAKSASPSSPRRSFTLLMLYRHEREGDMAQRTQVLLTCDVHDGAAEAVETVLYTVEGQSYECDLCDGHLTEFRDAMEIWSSHSRQAGRRRGGPTKGRAAKPSRST